MCETYSLFVRCMQCCVIVECRSGPLCPGPDSLSCPGTVMPFLDVGDEPRLVVRCLMCQQHVHFMKGFIVDPPVKPPATFLTAACKWVGHQFGLLLDKVSDAVETK